MKKFIHLFLMVLLFGACATQSVSKKTVPVEETNKVVENENENDNEYELVILDSEFESWFATQSHTSIAHSNEYYKNWNQLYVSEWNRLYTQGHPYFDTYIDYSPTEEYGLEINYKLYSYFKFIEKKTGISLVYR